MSLTDKFTEVEEISPKLAVIRPAYSNGSVDYIDERNSQIFESELEAYLDRNVVVDLQNINHVDSTGLGVLFSASIRLKRNGYEMRIANLNEFARPTFELVRMHKRINIYPSVEKAMESG